MKKFDEYIENVFFGYMKDRNFSYKSKLVNLEKERGKKRISKSKFYNGLISNVDIFLIDFERIFNRKRKRLLHIENMSEKQIEENIIQNNLMLSLQLYSKGKVKGFYSYIDAKNDKEFFEKAISNNKNSANV